MESTPKGQKTPKSPEGDFKGSLVFNEFPFRGQG